jgi:uncharacterized damage-inducible protein DinB
MFEEIVDYTQLADHKMIKVFNSTNIKMPNAERLFSHILNAQHVWIKRILGEVPLFGVWDLHPKDQFKIISDENFVQLKEIIKNISLDKKITYSNSKGDSFQNQVNEILFQLLNHSTYHRGQIATLFKKEGFEPPVTDYIFFKRELFL